MNKALSKAVLTIIFSLAAVSANANYTFTQLGSLSGNDPGSGSGSIARGMNEDGKVVGYAGTSNGLSHAFLWDSGTMYDLGTLGGSNSSALSINNSGKIVGYSEFPLMQSNGALWYNGAISNLNFSGIAQSINASDQIVGGSNNGEYGFFIENGNITFLSSLGGTRSYANSINDAGKIVGISQTSENLSIRATVWNNLVASDLGTLGGNNSFANSINNAGNIVGSADTSYGERHATLWSNGIATDLGTLSGHVGSVAQDINSFGKIVGTSRDAIGRETATLWDGTTAIDLNTYLSATDVANGWFLWEAFAINDSGTIAGTAFNSRSRGYRAFVLTPVAAPVPEADTSAMLLTGLGLVGFMARRQKAIKSNQK
jgi:probable HAF family extracellular repeat protein